MWLLPQLFWLIASATAFWKSPDQLLANFSLADSSYALGLVPVSNATTTSSRFGLRASRFEGVFTPETANCALGSCCCFSGDFEITAGATADQILLTGAVTGAACFGQTAFTSQAFNIISSTLAEFTATTPLGPVTFRLTLTDDNLVLTNTFQPTCSTGGARRTVKDDTIPASSMCASALAYPTTANVSFAPRISSIAQTEYAKRVEPFLSSVGTRSFVASLNAENKALCAAAIASLQCAAAYSPINATVNFTRPLCTSICTTLSTACSGVDVTPYISTGWLSTISVSDLLNCTSSARFPDGTALFASDSDCYQPTLLTAAATAANASTVLAAAVKQPQCVAYTGSVCQGVIDYSIYVPAGQTAAEFIARVDTNLLNTFRLGTAIAPISSGCQASLARIQCGSAYLACSNSTALPTATFAAPPCASDCQNLYDTCGSSLLANPQTASVFGVNCTISGTLIPTLINTATGTSLSQPVLNYPNGSYSCDGVSGLGTCQCNAMLTRVLDGSTKTVPVVSCPAPFKRYVILNASVTPITDSCSSPCPSPLFTPAMSVFTLCLWLRTHCFSPPQISPESPQVGQR